MKAVLMRHLSQNSEQGIVEVRQTGSLHAMFACKSADVGALLHEALLRNACLC